MPKNKQSNLIANVKVPNISFINKYIINSEIREEGGGGGGGYSVLVNYPSLLSNIFPLAPIIFRYKISTKYITPSEFYSIKEFCDLPAYKQENYNGIISHLPHSPLMQPAESCYAANFYATF